MSAAPVRPSFPAMHPPRPAVVPDAVCGRCWGPIVWYPLLGRRGCANWTCELRAFQAAMERDDHA